VGLSGLALTAKMMAAARALESRRADRLFEDPLAEALAGESGFALMERWRLPGAPLENPSVGPRTRFFDDLVREGVASGIGQVVLLGAGMDTRAFRLALGAETTVFELDEAELLAEKRELLERERAAPGCRRVAVAADLAGQWPAALLAAGFDAAAQSVFLVEALSWCVGEAALRLLLDATAELAPAGSRLGIDILSSDFLRSPSLLPLLELATANGVYWQFGTNDPVGFLAEHGWSAAALDAAALARRYGRWPPPGTSEVAAAAAAAAMPEYVLAAERVAR
jgi:methyltransferase (TIGR00027 family)